MLHSLENFIIAGGCEKCLSSETLAVLFPWVQNSHTYTGPLTLTPHGTHLTHLLLIYHQKHWLLSVGHKVYIFLSTGMVSCLCVVWIFFFLPCIAFRNIYYSLKNYLQSIYNGTLKRGKVHVIVRQLYFVVQYSALFYLVIHTHLKNFFFYIFTVKNLFAFQTLIDLSQVERRKRFLLKRMP